MRRLRKDCFYSMNKYLTILLLMAWSLLTVHAKDIYVSTSFHEPATEGAAVHLQPRRAAVGQHSGRVPAPRGGPSESDARPQHRQRSRRHLPSGVDQFVARRPRLRLFLVERPHSLDSPALHLHRHGHHHGEHLGAGTVLRRREKTVPHCVGLVRARCLSRWTGRPPEQPPPLLYHDEGLQDLLACEALLRARFLGHRRHAGEALATTTT